MKEQTYYGLVEAWGTENVANRAPTISQGG